MTCDFTTLARPQLARLRPFMPAAPSDPHPQAADPTDRVSLANNENPLGISALASRAMMRALRQVARYPNVAAAHLKAKLAERHGIAPAQITLGNGSNEVLELIARVFAGPGDEIVYSQYGFLVYPIVTQAVGAIGVEIAAREYGHDLDAMAAAITERARIVFIANPNNPTGTWHTREELRLFLEKLPPHVVVVVDEAYSEYVEQTDYPNAIRWIKAFPNLVVTRTFSKAFGLAGARIGYAIANEEIAELLNRLRQPFNLNSVGLAGAMAVLDDEAYLHRTREVNRSGMAQLTAMADRLRLPYIPSQGNFLALDLGSEAAQIHRALMQRGIVVRPLANYDMPHHLRVSIGLEEENGRFIAALDDVLTRRPVSRVQIQ